jgi:hypothetical protein
LIELRKNANVKKTEREDFAQGYRRISPRGVSNPHHKGNVSHNLVVSKRNNLKGNITLKIFYMGCVCDSSGFKPQYYKQKFLKKILCMI